MNPADRVVIAGHASAGGDYTDNLRYALERAERVRTLLLDGLSPRPKRVVVRSYGEARPVASNRTARGRALNRRVVVRVNYRVPVQRFTARAD